MDKMHTKTAFLAAFVLVSSVIATSPLCLAGQAVKWDYENNPVQIVRQEPASHAAVLGHEAESAFDGYGTQGAKSGAGRLWSATDVPSEEKPYICEVDYGRDVEISAFVHYFYVPDGLDYRYHYPGPSAFKKIRIWSKTQDGDWQQVVALEDMPYQCPQVLGIGEGKVGRYWRFEVLKLAEGAGALLSYEIETYTGGRPIIQNIDVPQYVLPEKFSQRMRQHKPETGSVSGEIKFDKENQCFDISLKHKGKRVSGKLALHEAKEYKLAGDGSKWAVEKDGGRIYMGAEKTDMGLLLNIRYEANKDNPVKFFNQAVKVSMEDAKLYYVPAYVWSRKPVTSLPNACYVQTRMVGLGNDEMMLCIVPGTDRGLLGIAGTEAQSHLVIGAAPVTVLITAVAGNWWDAFKFAVNDIYDFKPPQQTVPVSEMQEGIGRYMMSEVVWDKRLGSVKSWPEYDRHNSLYGTDYFNFYGTPYSVPTYLSRYIMNGDKDALERAKSVIYWLCDSHVRVQEGPAKGAFYTLQRFWPGMVSDMNATGATQGWGRDSLTSHSTGAALWSMLYYCNVTGLKEEKIDRAIKGAAQWLLKTQTPDGGWPYGHNAKTGEAVENATQSSGAIWDIWALWRMWQYSGDEKYLNSVKKATKWFEKDFMVPHYYHGYWEDVGPGSREGYEAAIAAIVFDEIGEQRLSVEAAKDAMQWVFTRQIECREQSCSAGLVAEQIGWPPASYCNPMMGLAASTAWRISGDDFWKSFAMIPKAVGWWYQQSSGAMVWIVDATQMAPIGGNIFQSWWSDWCIAQVGTLQMRWLVREVERFAGSQFEFNEEKLKGTLLGKKVVAWSPPEGFHPILPLHGQVNWLGFKGEDSIMVALINYGPKSEIRLNLDSRDLKGAIVLPKAQHEIIDGKVRSKKLDDSGIVTISQNGLVIMEWSCIK